MHLVRKKPLHPKSLGEGGKLLSELPPLVLARHTQLTPTINCPNSKQGEWLSERKTPFRDLSSPWNINLHLWDVSHCGVLQCTALNYNSVVTQKPWALSAIKTQYKSHIAVIIVIYVDAALPGSSNPHSSCLGKEPLVFIRELWVETEPSP